MRTIKN